MYRIENVFSSWWFVAQNVKRVSSVDTWLDPLTRNLSVTSCESNPALLNASIALEDEAWEQVGYLDHTASHHTYYQRIETEFSEYRLSLFDASTNEVLATAVCLPINLPPLDELPDEGWDWAVRTAFEQKGTRTASICALSVSVSPRHRRLGLARDVINAIRQLARMRDCEELIVPVRPTAKARYQHAPMSEYVQWKDERGRVFDPWLRSHLSVGGRVLSVCHRSMVVVRPLEFWRDWVQEEFDRNGSYNLIGGLSQLEVDLAADTGTYVEPNVWVRHNLRFD